MEKRPTQSRGGVKGEIPPCGVKGRSSLVGFGATPQSFHGRPLQRNHQQRRRQRSVPASNFARPQTRPPSGVFDHLHIVAPNGRDRTAGLSDIAALFCKQEISPLRRRPKGFPIALWKPSGRTPMFIDFYRSRENRACRRDKGDFQSLPFPLRRRHFGEGSVLGFDRS